MENENWSCVRCGASNETWRHWCRSCPGTQDEARDQFRAQSNPTPPIAPPPGPRSGTRVNPGVIVAVLVAVAVVGAAVYFLVGRGSSTSAATTPSPQQQADSAILRLDDLPAGFATSSSSSSSNSDDSAKQSADKCFSETTGISSDSDDAANKTADAKSKFESNSAGSVTVEAEVEFDRDPNPGSSALHVFTSPEVMACYQKLFEDSFAEKSVTLSDYQQVAVGLPAVGDERAGFEADFTVTGNTGRTARVGFVFAVVRKGDAFVTMAATGVNSDAAVGLVTDGLTTMVGRLS